MIGADFWDPDNKQRDFLRLFIMIYKNLNNEVKEYDDKLKKNKKSVGRIRYKTKSGRF